eukprot:TRINITY_DN5569_c0_g1_i1.p1 TRINITY_DN5569_c0_g1~~TRINITY_DN5569_c0_g1_i1.p1  ORF type:complete len:512 (-),score=61.08 TRINITY_DN5569_c0_g1_i1:507-2042(-)
MPLWRLGLAALLLLAGTCLAEEHLLPFDLEESGDVAAVTTDAALEKDVWHPHESEEGFGTHLVHRDHASSPFKKSYESPLEMMTSYLAADIARLKALSNRANGIVDSDMPSQDEEDIMQDEVSGAKRLPMARRSLAARSTQADVLNDLGVSGQFHVKVHVGTPPQRQHLVVDTDSALVFVQCRCIQCTVQVDKIFNDTLSSTFDPYGCNDPVCSLPELQYSKLPPICYQNAVKPCPYRYVFGSSYSLGTLIYETLHLNSVSGPAKSIKNFTMGCGWKQKGLTYADGIFGVGRTFLSAPTQLKKTNGRAVFSICLVSQQSTAKSQVVFGPAAVPNTGVTYTPLLTNKHDFIRSSYYVTIASIHVGAKRVDIPLKAFKIPNRSGGGTKIDTSTTYGFLTKQAWLPVVNALKAATKGATLTVHSGSFSPCWTITAAAKFPTLTITFVDGATLTLAPNHYLALVKKKVVCNTIQNAGTGGNILGSTLLSNNLVVFDQQGEKLGIKPMNCATGGSL